MRLIESLGLVNDPRRKEGMRHNLYQMFSMILLSGLCGHFGARGVERFSKAHANTFAELLKLKHPVPSHTSFNTFLNSIPGEELINAFHSWTNDYVPLEKEGVSGDGKALKSTLGDKKGRSFHPDSYRELLPFLLINLDLLTLFQLTKMKKLAKYMLSSFY